MSFVEVTGVIRMIRKSFAVTTLSLCGLFAASASLAQNASTMYAGVAYAQVDTDEVDFDDKPAALVGIVGWPLNDYFAVESRFGTGIQNGTFAYLGARGEYEITSYYGGFVRGTIPAGDGFNIYGILGYGKANQDANIAGFAASGSESGVAFGAGAELAFGQSQQHSFAVEWTQYVEDTSAIGVVYRIKF